MTADVYLGLGSNLGDRLGNLEEALARLAASVTLVGVSSAYETEPWGYTEQPSFLNAACSGYTTLSPSELLQEVKAIEVAMGRVAAFRYGPRLIDIDILLYGDHVLQTEEVTIPHPGMAERAFVLAPLAEIAPDVAHPLLGATVGELLQRLGPVDGVHRYEELSMPPTGARPTP